MNRTAKIKQLRSTLKNITQRICFLYLAIDDLVGVDRTLNSYKLLEEANMEAREISLIENLVDAYKTKDLIKFDDLIYKYGKITGLDPIDQKLINIIRKQLEKSEEQDI